MEFIVLILWGYLAVSWQSVIWMIDM
jgi:hypothetical protein